MGGNPQRIKPIGSSCCWTAATAARSALRGEGARKFVDDVKFVVAQQDAGMSALPRQASELQVRLPQVVVEAPVRLGGGRSRREAELEAAVGDTEGPDHVEEFLGQHSRPVAEPRAAGRGGGSPRPGRRGGSRQRQWARRRTRRIRARGRSSPHPRRCGCSGSATPSCLLRGGRSRGDVPNAPWIGDVVSTALELGVAVAQVGWIEPHPGTEGAGKAVWRIDRT